jgi:hypothetical protein
MYARWPSKQLFKAKFSIMKKKFLIPIIAGLLFAPLLGYSQQYNDATIDSLIKEQVQSQVTSNSKFLLTGYGAAGIQFTKEESSFGVSFSPIFLWKPDKRILFQAELETGLEGSETMIELEYGYASFFLNKYVTIRAGKFLSPFGIYQERLHPQWINKLPSIPLGFNHDEAPIGPPSEIGVDIRGGAQLGLAKINYSLYASNGPALTTDADISENGQLMYASAEDNNKNKVIGGRLGLLPFSNSSFEVGGSFQTGTVGDKGTDYENVKTQQYALDLSYVRQLDFLKGLFDVKAQWNWVNVDQANYINPEDSTSYTFSNKRNAGFAQAAYRPSMSQSKFLKKTELVFRYSNQNVPAAEDGKNSKFKTIQYTYGINFWYNWRTVIKLAYQSQKDNNAFYIQIATGF